MGEQRQSELHQAEVEGSYMLNCKSGVWKKLRVSSYGGVKKSSYNDNMRLKDTPIKMQSR